MTRELTNSQKLRIAYGDDTARRVREYRNKRGCSLSEAIGALVDALDQPAITEDQVKAAIDVLKAYAKQDLNIAPALLVELDEAVQDAYHGDIECEVEESA